MTSLEAALQMEHGVHFIVTICDHLALFPASDSQWLQTEHGNRSHQRAVAPRLLLKHAGQDLIQNGTFCIQHNTTTLTAQAQI